MFAVAVCFAFCYFAAFLLELYRFVRRNHWGIVPAALGFVLHTVFIYQQHIVAEQPLGGAAMFFHASAWGLVLIYFLWTYFYPKIPFGVVVLPLALMLLGGGFLSGSTFEPSGLSLGSVMNMLSFACLASGTIAFSIGSVCGFLYNLEDYLLRKKRSLTTLTRLPSLEWSRYVCDISITIGLITCFSVAVIFRVLYFAVEGTLPIYNPLVICTCSLLFIVSLYPLKVIFRLDRTAGRRFNYILIGISLVVVLFILVITIVSSRETSEPQSLDCAIPLAANRQTLFFANIAPSLRSLRLDFTAKDAKSALAPPLTPPNWVRTRGIDILREWGIIARSHGKGIGAWRSLV